MNGLPLDHVGVAVPDLEAGARPWARLGLPEAEDATVAEQGVRIRMLRAGTTRVELLAPLDDASPVARFLARRGPGLHHLAFRTPDLAAEMRRLAAAGARLVDAEPRRGHGGALVAFVHPSAHGGVLVELVERDG